MELVGIDDPTKINSALLQLRSAVKAFRNTLQFHFYASVLWKQLLSV